MVLAAFLQGTEFLAIGGVKPNLVFVLIVVLSFFIPDILYFLILMLVGDIVLRSEFASYHEILILSLLSIISFSIGKRLPGKPIFNTIGVVALATLLYYLFVDSGFVMHAFGTVCIEIVLNSALAGILFLVFQKVLIREYEKKIRSAI